MAKDGVPGARVPACLFEKYRIYDGSLEVRVGRRLTPKSGEEHATCMQQQRVNWWREKNLCPLARASRSP